MATAVSSITPEEFLRLPDNHAFELVDGELVEKNVGTLSSLTEMECSYVIKQFVDSAKLGRVFPSSLGIRCFPDDPDRVRRPDVCFVASNRFEPSALSDGYLLIAPDLVVEVVSPNDLAYEVERKTEEYLDADVRLIWILMPELRAVRVIRRDRTALLLQSTQTLSGEDVLPGFTVQVQKLFPTV